jgi:hypothetical protein
MYSLSTSMRTATVFAIHGRLRANKINDPEAFLDPIPLAEICNKLIVWLMLIALSAVRTVTAGPKEAYTFIASLYDANEFRFSCRTLWPCDYVAAS